MQSQAPSEDRARVPIFVLFDWQDTAASLDKLQDVRIREQAKPKEGPDLERRATQVGSTRRCVSRRPAAHMHRQLLPPSGVRHFLVVAAVKKSLVECISSAE